MEKGQKVTYYQRGDDEQVRWGEGDDPRIHLVFKEVYTIEEIIIHSWNTELHLKEIPGKRFNSVFFKSKPLMSTAVSRRKKRTSK